MFADRRDVQTERKNFIACGHDCIVDMLSPTLITTSASSVSGSDDSSGKGLMFGTRTTGVFISSEDGNTIDLSSIM